MLTSAFAVWLFKSFGAGSILKRFQASLLPAALIAGAVVLLLMSVTWLRHDAASTASRLRDAAWKDKLAGAQIDDLKQARDRDRASEAAAASERARLEAELIATSNANRMMEAELARLRAAGDDPVIYPRTLVRAMRR
jgi:hypothetical protein